MQSALWKIAALASVMGIAGYVLFEIHEQLPTQTAQTPVNPNDFPPLKDGDGVESQQLVTGAGSSIDEASKGGAFDAPPDDQSEPGTGQQSLNIASNATGERGSPFPEFDRSAATTESTGDDYNPFGAASLPGHPGTTASDGTLVTANASLPATGGDVEQVSAAQEADATAGNPFASFDWPAGTTDTPTDTADSGAYNPFDGQSEPEATAGTETADVQLNIAGADAQLAPETARGSLPELTFANDTAAGAFDPNEAYDPTVGPNAPYDPTIGGPQTEPAEESAPTTLTAESPTLQFGSQEAPADEQSPFLDLGPASGEAPAVAVGRSLPGLQTEPTPGIDFGPEPGSLEPSRLPANVIDDDGPPPRTALRSRDFAPLQPAQNTQQPAAEEPPFQIIPNPLRTNEPEAPSRSDFVGDATLDGNTASGPQQPELTIQKVAPTDATVGDPLVYAIKVKNVGNSTARDVIVEDRIPRGTTLEGSIPQAELTDRKLIWQLGHMEPGAETTIRIKVVPTEPGNIGSVATVRFVAEVAATTRITTPSLTMDLHGPAEVAVGEQVVFKFRIANVGEGEARNVYVRNMLPPGFEHPGGSDIEYDVGSLRPGESRDIDLAVRAATEGVQTLTAQLNTGTTTRAESQSPVNVIASRLLIQRTGPKHRFVGRPADYTTTVSNRSGNALRGVTVVEQLPTGMELAAAPDGGHFDAQRRTITWRIPELTPGAQTTLRTSVIASQKGVLQGVVKASDANGNLAQLASVLEVAGFASLTVDLEHEGTPVAIGDPVAMQFTVKNRGTGAAEHVEAQFAIPDHLTFVNAEGPVEFELDPTGRTLRFAAIDEIDANEEETFKIMLTAAAAGNNSVTAQLSTSDMAGPLQQAGAVIVEADGQ